jgi:hypothetical protein
MGRFCLKERLSIFAVKMVGTLRMSVLVKPLSSNYSDFTLVFRAEILHPISGLSIQTTVVKTSEGLAIVMIDMGSMCGCCPATVDGYEYLILLSLVLKQFSHCISSVCLINSPPHL